MNGYNGCQPNVEGIDLASRALGGRVIAASDESFGFKERLIDASEPAFVGMYDLRGPRLSRRSSYVKFTDEAEEKLSPQRHIARINAPIVLLFGSLETPEFQRQSREFADALTRAGKSAELIYAEGYNHFEIAETLGNPHGPMGRAVLALMKLPIGSSAASSAA